METKRTLPKLMSDWDDYAQLHTSDLEVGKILQDNLALSTKVIEHSPL